MTTAQICIIIAIAVYLIAMVCVGVAYSRTSKGGADNFYLGGRKLGPVVTAMSAEASDMSSWLLMGLPGVAYFTGIADAAWTAIGLALGTYLNFLLVAKRLRIYSAEINAITGEEIVAVIDFSSLSSAGEYTLPVNIVVSGYENVSAKGNYQVNVRLDTNGTIESERTGT